jgi:hypothetical protein
MLMICAKSLRLLSLAFFACLWGSIARAQTHDPFYDGFEAATIDPFWEVNEQSGSIDPTTAREYAGAQSVQFANAATGNTNLGLIHLFPEPRFGRVTVRVYDGAAASATSNFLGLQLYNTATNGDARIFTQDYTQGNGGQYWFQRFATTQGPTTINRTVAWHEFSIDVTPAAATWFIDGTVVATESPGMPFDYVKLYALERFPTGITANFDEFILVPEPATNLLMAAGLGCLALVAAVKHRRSA